MVVAGGTRVPKRVVWKAGDLICIKLRDDLFTVAQMARSPYLAFFNVKGATGAFEGVDLNEKTLFFVIPVAQDFIQKRVEGKIKKGVEPRKKIVIPQLWIDAKTDYASKFMWKGGSLVEFDPEKGGNRGINNRIVELNFEPQDDDELNRYEVTNVRTDGGLVQRLIVCLELGRNVDPFKEKMMRGTDPYGVYD